MFTPPNPGQPSSSSSLFGPSSGTRHQHQHQRQRPLPARSSLSNSFSLAPWDDSILTDHDAADVSVSFAHVRRRRLSITEQGTRGIGQVSPRQRPRRGSTSSRTVVTATATASTGTGRPKSKLVNDSNVTRRTSPRKHAQARQQEQVVEAEPEEVIMTDDEGEEEEEVNWGMIDSMRLWRQDAITQHMYQTAAFWGDKILSWTADPNDAFWLAQTYFLTGHYLRAERILTEPLPPPALLQLATNGAAKGKERAHDVHLENVMRDRSAHAPTSTSDGTEGRVALASKSLACRYLVVQCLVHQEKYSEALELLGESQPFSATSSSRNPEYQTPARDDGIKLASSLCQLRGSLHLRLSSLALAKESLMEALMLDVKNYEAFRELVDGNMMSSTEEWEFIDNLSYRAQLSDEQANFVKLMYRTKLKKDAHVQDITLARKELVSRYGLSNNPDVLVALADELYARYKWEDCYTVTSKILHLTPSHPSALPLHLACMHHIQRLRSSLFMLAHDLVDQDPQAATTWYAVGLWYFSGKRWGEARRYFSKANLIDSRFAPAWIAFAHSFAYEGEHDQAITAYSTTARLFPGSHLPMLFIGMEYLQLSTSHLAEEWFLAAQQVNASDPLLLNELGVIAYNKNSHLEAIDYFTKAIQMAKDMQGVDSVWAVTWCNLGHSYRITGNLPASQDAYTRSLALDPTSATAITSLALLSHIQGDVRKAIRLYHQSLALGPQDPMATVLLEMALREQVDTLEPRTLPGLPGPLSEIDLDPFRVPKGNAAFGPLPVEHDPDSLADAGNQSSLRPAAADTSMERFRLGSAGPEALAARRGNRWRSKSPDQRSVSREPDEGEETMEIEEDD